MYHQDWLMRQIEMLSSYVFHILLGKADELTGDVHIDTKKETAGDGSGLGAKLTALVRVERFCEAENLLYAAVEEGEPEALTAGLRFYSDLNALPDETLVRCNFPRDEILSGLQELCAACGYDLSVLDA